MSRYGHARQNNRPAAAWFESHPQTRATQIKMGQSIFLLGNTLKGFRQTSTNFQKNGRVCEFSCQFSKISQKIAKRNNLYRIHVNRAGIVKALKK